MNKSLLIAGGTILVAGGLAYWYLSQQGNGGGCQNGTVKCVGYDLYTCVNNQWQLTQNNAPQCQGNQEHCQYLLPGDDPGYGYPTGWRSCDAIAKELCQWDNTNKKWDLIQENSPICINNLEQNKCYTSTASNLATCGIYAGDGPDECLHADAAGCSCATGECRPPCYCCTDSVCRLKATSSYLFYATNTNGLTCWRDGNIRWARYNFNESGIQLFREPIAFNQLIGLKVHLSGTQFGPFDAGFFKGYNGAPNEIWDFGCAAVWCCATGCNPIVAPDIWASPTGPLCMDSFLVGIASPTGPPDITAIECKFGFG